MCVPIKRVQLVSNLPSKTFALMIQGFFALYSGSRRLASLQGF